jgi:MFS family permease
MLLCYCLQTINNALLWITFASVANGSSRFFGVGIGWVNVLSVSFMILYLPGSILASYIITRWGLRRLMVIGAALNLLSAAVRYAGVGYVQFIDSAGGGTVGFAILLLGQCIGAMAQPLFTNAPVKLAGVWFKASERDVATVIAALANPIGMAMGQVVPSFFVTDDDFETAAFGQLLLLEIALTGVAFVWAAHGFQEAPPTPPSASARDRIVQAKAVTAEINASASAFAATMLELRRDTTALLTDRNFLVLFVGFGFGLGAFNALLTVLAQMVAPCGYTTDDAAMFGGTLIGAGTVGAGLAGGYLDASHNYRPVLKGGYAFCWATVVFFLLSLKPDNGGMLTAAFALMGSTMLPLYPVTLENAVECTYPMSEEGSGGLLLLAGNVLGMCFTFVLGYTIEEQGGCQADVTKNPSALFLFAMLTVCVLVMLTFNGQYKRLEAEGGGGGGNGVVNGDDDDGVTGDVI